MSKIDWSKAPEGTTHAKVATGRYSWRMVVGEQSFYWADNCRWERLSIWDLAEYTERPPKTWTGEGLPPVGTVCEYRAGGSNDDWVPVQVVAHWQAPADMTAVYVDLGSGRCSKAVARCFRPARTAEQIEQYERDAHEMACPMTGHRDRSKDCFLTLAKILLDAGYRKVGDQ